MLVRDRLYGTFQINSPVFLDLFQSQALIRLKGISQMGIPHKFYHLKTFSRFEHSVGVMLLLRRLGTNEEEQIAGLLHDISHTAFSHLVDWLIGSGETEDFQDKQHIRFLIASDVAKILKKHGFNPNKIAQHEHFSLLEQPIPYLCADRIDYALREFPSGVSRKILNNLTVKKKKIVFKNKSSAKLFAISFLNKQMDHWGGFEAVSRYIFFGSALKKALNLKIINFSDFWKDDEFVLKKLKRSQDPLIKATLKFLQKKSLKGLPLGEKTYLKKFRYVDPLVIYQKKLFKLSSLDKDFKKQLQKTRNKNKRGIRIPRSDLIGSFK